MRENITFQNSSTVEEDDILNINQLEITDSSYDQNDTNILFKNDIIGNAVDLISRIYKTIPSIKYIRGGSRRKPESESSHLSDSCSNLPTSVLLQIFSYLDVSSLCKAAHVCQAWNNLANDSILWEQKLNVDSHLWERIDHLSHPRLHQETNPDLTPKEIYLRCCPECKYFRRRVQFPTQIPKLSYFFGLSIPRIVMFGSGLDSSGIVNRVIIDQRSPFSIQGLFPGNSEGTGSGVTLEYSDGRIDLICLYASSKAERENSNLNAKRQSRLLVNDEISHSVKQLCNTVDAFIYIVNAETEDRVNIGCEEFKALIDDRWLKPKIPVLVLCVVPNATCQSVSSLKVANKLNLLNLSRPWQVRQCHVNSLYGFMPGVTWIQKLVMGL